MNDEERLNLKHLLDQSDFEDNTDNIRKLKHSVNIRNDIRKLENLKISHLDLKSTNPDEFYDFCCKECPFLFNKYTDIFNKEVKDELNLTIMTKLLTILKMIEDNKIDQNKGSIMVGKILKELYIDSAIKRMDNLDKQYVTEDIPKVVPKNITWSKYKNELNNNQI
jgi:hypothetical protein